MPHPEIKNSLGYGYDSLLVSDVAGMPTFVPLVQATFAIDGDGTLSPTPKQLPPLLAGQWYGDPEHTSLELEPQIAFHKLATDIVLHGHAYPEAPGAARGQVGIRVGTVQKLAYVFGDRYFIRTFTGLQISTPTPFERIPIVYERCFGGWDRRHEDANLHRCEPRNPVGVGFHDASLPAQEGLRLPNFEDPEHPYRGYGDTPPPAGFGFIAPHWQPRVTFAGTYDAAWDRTRKPLLPLDFDARFFNSATPGLSARGHLRGDEEIIVIGATPDGRLACRLPGVPPPLCVVDLRRGRRVAVSTSLDTMIVNTDERTVVLLWRGHLPLPGGMHDVVSVDVCATADAMRAVDAEPAT